MALESGTTLSCGASLDGLLRQITDLMPASDAAHQATCPYCQAALAALREAWGDLQDLARQPVKVPADLGRRIMARIRAMVAQWRDAAVLSGGSGETRIAHPVIAQIARRAALAVPGVVLASALGVSVDPADRDRVSLSLRLAIAFGPAVDALAGAVREEVARQLAGQTGLRVDAVDISVEDIVSGS